MHLAERGGTVRKLRKLLGVEKSSEKRSDVCDNSDGSEIKNNIKNNAKKPKSPNEDGFSSVKPAIVKHEIQGVNKGDNCPECLVGKVYKVEPGSLLRITGQTPFTPEQHILASLRCNTCGAYFSAPLP